MDVRRTRTELWNTDNQDVDSGWAWVVLIASFVVNSISLGTNFSFGVFYAEFFDYFEKGHTQTALLISLACGLVLCAGPFAGVLANRFGARIVIIIGSLVTAAGYFLSAFVPRDSFWAMFITFGFMTGIGSGLSYSPSFGVLPLYFRKRRNFATALVTAGNGVGIFIFSNLFRFLIAEYGWRGAMFVNTGIALNVLPCGMAVFKRQPPGTGSGFAQFTEFSLFRETTFYLTLVHFLTSGSYYIFIVLCIKFAQEKVGVSKEDAPWLLTIHGATNIAGRTLVAVLSATPYFAKMHSRFFLMHLGSVSIGLCLALYPFCTNFTTICIAAAFTGFAWGWKFALLPGINMDVFKPQRFNSSWGYLVFALGLAFLWWPALGTTIADGTGDFASAFYFGGFLSAIALACSLFLHFLMYKKVERQRTTTIELRESQNAR